jgi:Holliday junction resolvase RusA-like endonuclease
LSKAQQLRMHLPMVGKARPRVTSQGTYMPKAYQQWQRDAQAELRLQWARRPPLERVGWLTVQFRCPQGRVDLDNALGSVLDALVRAGVLVDDNATRVPAVSAMWERSEKSEILITLEPLWTRTP